jgi:hypothetical protein
MKRETRRLTGVHGFRSSCPHSVVVDERGYFFLIFPIQCRQVGWLCERRLYLGGACLDFFERDDEGATGADVGAGDVVEIDEGTGSEMRNG